VDRHPLEQTDEPNFESKPQQITVQIIKEMPSNQSVPVIGILTQVLRDYKRFSDKKHLHLASSYVKWIESAGAQVLPILLNENDAYYEQVFRQTNGLLLPGGDNLLDPNKRTPMMLAASKLYKLAVEANNRGDYYPIWGTCLGLELLSVLSSGKNVLDSCESVDVSLPMKFVERGRLFEPNKNSNLKILDELDYSKMIMDTLKKEHVAYNYHRKCLTDDGLERANLKDFYKPLAYSQDQTGLKFISIFEAIQYPFFGVQFHPEKPAFEFTSGKGHHNVPHSRQSIEVSRYFADFFVRQAERNKHRANGSEEEDELQKKLIYAYNPTYTAPLNDLYEQRYLFPFDDSTNWKTHLELLKEAPQGSPPRIKGQPYRPPGVSPIKNPDLLIEFVEHVPEEDEVIPEDVEQPPPPTNSNLAPIELETYESSYNPPQDEVDTRRLPMESKPSGRTKRGKKA